MITAAGKPSPLYVKRFGLGERAYFGIHGWSGTHLTFAPLADLLPHDASLHCPDLPGHGRSPGLPAGADLEAVADDIAATLASLGLRDVTMIGNCSGALVALLAEPAIRERVARWVLIDPFAFVPWYFRIFTARGWGRYAYYTTFANPLGRRLTDASLRGHRTTATSLTRSFDEVDHATSYRYLQLFIALGGIERFSTVTAPIDLLVGERSFAAVRESARRWQAILPHARVHELAGAGHLPIQEATAQVAHILFGADGMGDIASERGLA